jgi:hypothetical protein
MVETTIVAELLLQMFEKSFKLANSADLGGCLPPPVMKNVRENSMGCCMLFQFVKAVDNEPFFKQMNL